jgi:SAM-dependent methyltransferase
MIKSIIRKQKKLVLYASKLLTRKGLKRFILKSLSEERFNGPRILSVGAGGEVGEILNKYRQDVGGTLTQLDIDEARQPDVIADICKWSNPDAFDVIVLSEVLEHVASPQSAIDNIHKSLKDGGLLIITVPFVLPIHEAPFDFYRYTKWGLVELLKPFSTCCVSERTGYFETFSVLLARSIRADVKNLRNFAFIFVFIAYLLWPVFLLLDMIFKAHFMPAGYFVICRK